MKRASEIHAGHGASSSKPEGASTNASGAKNSTPTKGHSYQEVPTNNQPPPTPTPRTSAPPTHAAQPVAAATRRKKGAPPPPVLTNSTELAAELDRGLDSINCTDFSFALNSAGQPFPTTEAPPIASHGPAAQGPRSANQGPRQVQGSEKGTDSQQSTRPKAPTEADQHPTK
jgi:hypothetical protein